MPKRVTDSQSYLFPIDLRELADSIGIDWWAVKKLYDDKWLSFDPDQRRVDCDALYNEFMFLGSLVSAGCDPYMMKRFLAGLDKPYQYDLSSIYYDWPAQEWKNLPKERDPREITSEYIALLEENGDYKGLKEVLDQGQKALNTLNELHEEDLKSDSYDKYAFNPEKSSIILATKKMLWKIVSSSILDTPSKRVVLGKMIRVIQLLPKVTLGEELRLELCGPRRMFGNHEIYHWWTIDIQGDGTLSISSGGHFYRPETGGDSFSSMSWEVFAGHQPAYQDYLHSLTIIDDADTFENEVERIYLEDDGYEVSVEDPSLEDWKTNDVGGGEESEDA